MTVIRVNPESVRAYATDANTQFAACRTELESLVTAVVGVAYAGPNAKTFKDTCGQMAVDFSAALLAEIRNIAGAVSTSTTNIAASLGGAPIEISVDGSPITAPTVEEGTTFDADTTALDDLTSTVDRHLNAVGTALDEHLTKLGATDWEGTAKQNAVGQATTITNTAKTKVTDAKTKINQYIRDQVDSVNTADK
jgi:hypothetical protein